MATLSNLIHYYLYWKPCLYGDKGGEMFIIFQLNFSLWVELCLWPVTFLYSFPQCQLGERKANGGCREKTLPLCCWRRALVKSFLLNSKPLLWKGFWVFHKDYSSFLSAKTKKGSSWSLIMTVWWSSWSEWNPMKPCVPPGLWYPRSFSPSHSASSYLSELSFKCSYLFTSLEASATGRQVLSVTFWIHMSPNFRVALCSATSGFWWSQEKLIFHLSNCLL